MIAHAVPKLRHLHVDGLTNGSILLEWELEYDGGYPVLNFEIHITSGAGRARRDTTVPDLVYHTDVYSGRLITRAIRQGQTYVVMATAYNNLGASDPQTANGLYMFVSCDNVVRQITHFVAFVGHTDAVSCGYDDSDDARGCPWQLQEGHITNAQGSGIAPLPDTDSNGNRFGNNGSTFIAKIHAISMKY